MAEQAIIAGIGETRVGRHPDRSCLELQAEAVRRAVADAGFAKTDIDAVYALGSYIRPMVMHAASLSEYLGLRPRFEASVDIGGTATFIGMALDAVAAVEEGRIETAVCVYGDNAASRRPVGSHGFTQQVEYGTEDFEDPFGQTVLVSYALLARRYLDVYGLAPEQAFAPIAIAMRENAGLNENAAQRKVITVEDYRLSEPIADPFRRLDCSPLVDGAGAFLITSKAKARAAQPRRPAISILGTGTKMTHKIVSQMPDIDELGMASAGRQAFAKAGLVPGDIDLVTAHDGFTVSIPLTLEQLGFCTPGDAWRLAAEGAFGCGGTLPTNTHGGLLSQGHVGGVLHVIEAVRQLRGEAGPRQVEKAETALVAGVGGTFSVCGAMILGRN